MIGVVAALSSEAEILLEQTETFRSLIVSGKQVHVGRAFGKDVAVVICGVGKVKIEGVTKYIVPLFAAMVVALFLVTFIPAIALVVPYLCGLVPSLGWTM